MWCPFCIYVADCCIKPTIQVTASLTAHINIIERINYLGPRGERVKTYILLQLGLDIPTVIKQKPFKPTHRQISRLNPAWQFGKSH